MSNHTKDDWKWKQNRGNNYYEHSVFTRDKVLAELSGEGCTKDEVKANARLIAAAPRMYNYINRLATIGHDEAHNEAKQILKEIA